MQIRVTTRHGNLNDELRKKLVTKVEKLPRFFERLTDIELIVDLQDPQRPHVDLKVSAEHKHDFSTKVEAADALTAVEQAVQKMEQQLRKYKEKLVDRGRGPEAAMSEMPGEQPVDEADEDDETT